MNDPISWPLYFWLFFKASLFSTGGTGNLPSLHADLPAHGWASEQQFGEALTIGQVSPGPTGLWVVSLALLLASGAVMQWAHLPVLVILLGAGSVGAFWGWGRHRARGTGRD